ncbi:MAG: ABC transporter permease [Zetaproteobacteria bacterium]|nr:ABC transporter permease [Zetaproteobacteria bacterium]
MEAKIEYLGRLTIFVRQVLGKMFAHPWRRHLFWQQSLFIGYDSIFIIILTGSATGAVFGLQIGGVFSFFKAEGFIGGATGLALVKELAPLVSGFVLAGRVGSAITAELSTMVVNEQVEAMEAMGIDPLHYLVVPRVWAAVFTMPFLCSVFIFVGMLGVYFVGSGIFAVSEGLFMAKIVELVKTSDILFGLQKMALFSAIIALLACYHGLHPLKGAEGVGLATTTAVVQMLLVILIADVLMSYLQVNLNL